MPSHHLSQNLVLKSHAMSQHTHILQLTHVDQLLRTMAFIIFLIIIYAFIFYKNTHKAQLE